MSLIDKIPDDKPQPTAPKQPAKQPQAPKPNPRTGRISCTQCSYENDPRRTACKNCGIALPQPKTKASALSIEAWPVKRGLGLSFRDGLEFGGGLAIGFWLVSVVVIPIIICALSVFGIGLLGA